jgi:hypothetical protein
VRTQKDKRHSGYVTPPATISPKEVIEHDWFINDYYSDWDDYRDGFRDWYKDATLIKKTCHKDGVFKRGEMRARMNAKQRKLLRRRKKRASAQNAFNSSH